MRPHDGSLLLRKTGRYSNMFMTRVLGGLPLWGKEVAAQSQTVGRGLC